MPYPTYAELVDKTDGVDTVFAEDVNLIHDAVKEVAGIVDGLELTGGTGGRGAYDIIMTVSGGTYTAYNASGVSQSANTSLATVWNAVVTAGTHVHFASGAYTFTAELDLFTGCVVTGTRGKSVLTRTGTGLGFNATGTSGTPLTDISISGLTIIGPSVGGTQVVGSGIYFEYVNHSSIFDCDISGFGSDGDDASIEIARGVGLNIHHNYLHDSKNGLCTGTPNAAAIRVSESTFGHNIVYDNFDDGIHDQCGARNTIIGNICYGHPNGGASDGSGIDMLGSRFCTVTGNVCYDNARGIEVGNTADDTYPDIGHTITNNVCTGNTSYGMSLIAGFERGLVANNIIESNTTDGIRFGTATSGQDVIDVAIRGNQIHSNGTSGIDCFGYNTRAIIQDNNMSGHSTADIRVRTSTGTPATYALLDNRTLSTTGISDTVNAGDKVQRLFGA
jgi:parallel beta-helix repeat protein